MDPKFLNLFDSESSKGSSENNPLVPNVTVAAPPPPSPPPSTQFTCHCSKTFSSVHELLNHQILPCLQNRFLSQNSPISPIAPLGGTRHHNPTMFPTNNSENTFHAYGFANYQLYHPYKRPQELQLFPTSPEGPRTIDLISLIDNQPRGTGVAANGTDRMGWGATIGLEFIDVNLDLKL